MIKFIRTRFLLHFPFFSILTYKFHQLQIYKIFIKKVCVDVVDVTHINIVCSNIAPCLAAPCSLRCWLQDQVPHVKAELRAGVGQEVVQEAREVRETGRVQVPGEGLLLGEQGAGRLGLMHPGVGVRRVWGLVRAGQWGHRAGPGHRGDGHHPGVGGVLHCRPHTLTIEGHGVRVRGGGVHGAVGDLGRGREGVRAGAPSLATGRLQGEEAALVIDAGQAALECLVDGDLVNGPVGVELPEWWAAILDLI